MRSVIDKYSGLPFKYGLDCCQFASEFIEAQTGIDPAPGVDYKSKAEADKLINKYGDLEGLMIHFLGEPYDGCKNGDVCIMDNNIGDIVAAVIYRDRIVARVPGGLMDYDIDRAIKVWCI
ncbi:MAG: hypothetical protein JRE40_12505 [Deltaproteobacteria bacterium]|nr:hypothetical protein [Deltaproteobacteria bacterium]